MEKKHHKSRKSFAKYTGDCIVSFIQPAFSLAYDFRLAISAVYYCRTLYATYTAVDDQVYDITEFLVNQFGVGTIFNVFIFIVRECGSHDGSVQQACQFLDNRVVGHADSYFLAVTKYLRQADGAVQDKSESARQVAFH